MVPTSLSSCCPNNVSWFVYIQNILRLQRMAKLQGQRDIFDKQRDMYDEGMAEAERAASSFDSHMARAALEASDMKEAFDKLTCESADQRKSAAEVCIVYSTVPVCATSVRCRHAWHGGSHGRMSCHVESLDPSSY